MIKSRRRSKQQYVPSRDRMSLLAHQSPPPSPAPVYPSLPDPHVNAQLFPEVSDHEESFEAAQSTCSTSRGVNLFLPQHGKAKEETTSPAALQFVPAYEEATSPVTTVATTPTEESQAAAASWDNLLHDADGEDFSTSDNVFRRGRNTTTMTATPSPRKSLSTHTTDPRKMRSKLNRSSDSLSAVSSSTSQKRGRIQRLAAMFTSRAVVRGGVSTAEATKTATATVAAASPPSSESSSGYVGWPGTQDKRGGTVPVRKTYSNEMEEAVDLEVKRWMNPPSLEEEEEETSSVEVLTPPSRPRPQPPQSAPPRHFDPYGDGGMDDENVIRFEEANPADFHLAAAVADAAAAAAATPQGRRLPGVSTEPPRRRPQGLTLSTDVSRNLDGIFRDGGFIKSPMSDPWDVDETPSTGGTDVSKDSAELFRVNKQVKGVSFADDSFSSKPQPPTEEALAVNNHFTPPSRTLNAHNAKGYRGFLDKTREVPNLMDAVDSDSMASSSRASSAIQTSSHTREFYRRHSNNSNTFRGKIGEDDESDVFDGIGSFGDNASPKERYSPLGAVRRDVNEAHVDEKKEQGDLNLVLLGGGLTAIQSPANEFANRATASDFDDGLSNSDVDQFGFARIPGFQEMARAGRSKRDGSLNHLAELPESISPKLQRTAEAPARRPITRDKDVFDISFGSNSSSASFLSDPEHAEGHRIYWEGDLSQYAVHPDDIKLLVKKFRKMVHLSSMDCSYEEFEKEEDAKKAFALFEMRSRVMEKDIERGLERSGGTTVVDDLVTTPYHQRAMRIRDAVIVCKAWRDGARPMDVINTAKLTNRAERTYFVKRPLRRRGRRHAPLNDSASSYGSFLSSSSRYTWEEVGWTDDTDFMQYRCPSLGPRNMRGFEIFTIGDCQSILLKLTNLRCIELREQLNEATAVQIEAEEIMKHEDHMPDGMMSEAEMTYLTAMEEVKTVSKKLVVAEKAFNLVRDRIERLVARYEALLMKIETDSTVAPSSVVTYESSYYSDYGSGYAAEEEREKEMLSRRAQRAEVRAELAAREALLAKQEARQARQEKERELQVLQQKLCDLQSESSHAISDREHSVVLAKAIAARRGERRLSENSSNVDRTKINDVKERFRARKAARMRGSPLGHENEFSPKPSPSYGNGKSAAPRLSSAGSSQESRNSRYRLAGEEMFQHLDFYERSLKAVDHS